MYLTLLGNAEVFPKKYAVCHFPDTRGHNKICLLLFQFYVGNISQKIGNVQFTKKGK